MKVFVCFAAALCYLALVVSAQNSTEIDGGSRDGRKKSPIAASSFTVAAAEAGGTIDFGTAGIYTAIKFEFTKFSVAATTANVRHTKYNQASKTLTYKVYIPTLSTSGTAKVTYTPTAPAGAAIPTAAAIPFTLSFTGVVVKVSVPNVSPPFATAVAPATLTITSASIKSATITTTGVLDAAPANIDTAFNSAINLVLKDWIIANPVKISTFVGYYIGKL